MPSFARIRQKTVGVTFEKKCLTRQTSRHHLYYNLRWLQASSGAWKVHQKWILILPHWYGRRGIVFDSVCVFVCLFIC